MREQTLILSSGKCSWGKCFACGWGRLEAELNEAKLRQRLQYANFRGLDRLKIFGSGSFFDSAQFPRAFRQFVAEKVRREGVKELVVESRPEFVTKETLADFKGMRMTVAIGLESASDAVLKKYCKGFTVADYEKAAKMLKKNKFGLRTYVMVNIPFGTQKDLDASVKFALKHSDSVVLINTYPHVRAPLWQAWVDGKWAPFDKKQFETATKNWAKTAKVELDFQNYLFIPKFPPEKRRMLKGVGREFLEHPYYDVWQDFFRRFYTPPEGKDIALFLPCAYQKPYSRSETHRAIDGAIRGTKAYNKIHKIVISSPGVIPFEYSGYYPFAAYDWPEWEETPEIKKAYTDVTEKRIKAFLQAHGKSYKKILCYFKPDAESYIALKKACKSLKIKLVDLIDEKTYSKVKQQKNPLSQPAALAALRKNLEKVK